MPDASRKTGTLYVVATPIGNLEDMSFRATTVLKTVDVIAAEDTRTSRKLLTHIGASTPLMSYHEHNEHMQSGRLISRLLKGHSVALISDAGTPVISDPGFRLISKAHEHGVTVVPVPGACAAIAALSVSGLPTDRFAFEGFLPAKATARRKRLSELAGDPRTLVFYEASHRILNMLTDVSQILGADRELTLAREITKKFETVRKGTASGVLDWVQNDPDQQRGEFVVVVQGGKKSEVQSEFVDSVLTPLMAAVSLRQAVDLAADITGEPRNEIYRKALRYKT